MSSSARAGGNTAPGIDEQLFVGEGGHPLAGRHLGAHRGPLIVDQPSPVMPESLVPKE